MILLFLLSISIIMLHLFDIEYLFIFKVANYSQEMCVLNIPKQSSFPEIYKSIVCGLRLPSNKNKLLLTNAGLIHLFVVSGAHLQLIKKLGSKIINNNLFILFLLGGYTLLTGASPPVLKAFIFILLKNFSDKFDLSWTSSQTNFKSTLLCILLNINLINSYSLILSSIAIQILIISNSNNLFKSQIKFYILMIPTLILLQIPSPLTILINYFLIPILIMLHLPLTLFTYFFRSLVLTCDFLWEYTFRYFKYLDSLHTPINFKLYFPHEYLWIYFVFLVLITRKKCRF